MHRRGFLATLGMLGLAGCAGLRYWPDEGLWNRCVNGRMPEALAQHDLVQAAWQGLDTAQVWDCHTHLIGTGDSDSGIWVNPNMESPLHLFQYVQFKFYLNAACAGTAKSIDQGYVQRLVKLNQGMASGVKFMLLAFDYHYDEKGGRVLENSPFYTPNDYAASVANQYPENFEWIASIHPYREDCVEALEQVVAAGARAVKWLPGSMGMNPASPLCDRFYAALRRLNIPLLIHAGTEYAVHVDGLQGYGNPLLMRRPLDLGIRVIVAHCASLGRSIDIDKGANRKGSPEVDNFELFARLMSEPAYVDLLYGDIAAVTQVNRDVSIISRIIQNLDWHDRLINGSDYPLPGVMPVFSMRQYVNSGLLPESEAKLISAVREYNPMLFDFILKRRIQVDGKRLPNRVFESRRLFI